MTNPFFSTGYKEIPKPKSKSWTDEIPSENFNVAINVMGDLYEGQEKIEITEGDIIVDGVKTGKAPLTSGTWIKLLKGKKIENKILTYIP